MLQGFLVLVNTFLLLEEKQVKIVSSRMKKNTLGQRLKRARLALGISQEKLAERLDISQQRYQSWEVDKYEPDYEMYGKLTEALRVNAEWLFGEHYRGVEPANMPGRLAPLISWVKAGHLHFPSDDLQPGESEGPALPTSSKDPNVFALRVKGNSMLPEFADGDIIIVSPNSATNSGDYIIAKVNSEVTFKQLKKYPTSCVLRPLNPAYEEIVLEGEECRDLVIVGRVIEKIKRY